MNARRLLVVQLAVLAGCRLGFDELGAPDAGGWIEVAIVGVGAVSAGSQACADQCQFDSDGDLTITAIPGEGWQLVSFSVPCGGALAPSDCTIARGTSVTVTFARLPITANRVFVSSTTPPPGNGVAALDMHCETLAATAGLSGSFVAFVSSNAGAARDRLTGSRGWVRADGLPIADLPTGLGSAPRGIDLDEHGAFQTEYVMTGSNATGDATGSDCQNWTSATGSSTGGLADASGSYMFGTSNSGCNARVFCFETGKVVPVELAPPAFPVGRYVFVSVARFATSGIGAADAICQDEATTAGLPGNYRALLATTTQSITERVGSVTGTFRRPDGIVVTRQGLDRAPYDATITTHADGSRAIEILVNRGAPSDTALGTAESTCGDWTDPAGNAGRVHGFRHLRSAYFTTSSCANAVPLFCVQVQ